MVAADLYAERRDRFAAAEAADAVRSRRLSIARLVVAAAALFALGSIVVTAAAPDAWPFVLLAVAVALFAALALVHDRVIRSQRRHGELAALNREGLARLDRRWADLPPALAVPPEHLPPEQRGTAGAMPPVARDLGLFGPASLAHLTSTARTPAGRLTLGRWLLAPAAPEEIAARQPAVAELAAAPELRQDLELAGRTAPAGDERPGGNDPEPFLAWAEGEPWISRRPLLLWTARLSPPVTVAVGFAALLGLVPAGFAGLALVANLVLTFALQKPLAERLDRVSAGSDELAAYAAALAVAAAARFDDPRLATLATDLGADGEPAARWMRRLAQRVAIADARHGSFHVIAQVLTLWDFHALWWIERWQAAAGRHVRRWLTALGELEALAALATLAHDEPDWCFPTVAAGEPSFEGTHLGHPLIAGGARVGNDVTVGPAGTFLLVTGSNMSGKSTLLRAVGLNATLAQAGGPVCAEALSLPPLALATSVLVEDSLEDGVSFFLAELLRLKQVVAAADAARGEGKALLYLLDEVLRGTNSEERRQAVAAVVGHLLAAGALGAVSTHDLELAAMPELAAAAVQVHFREQVRPPGGDGPPMTFDYLLRPGPATTRNALALMAAVGLEPPA